MVVWLRLWSYLFVIEEVYIKLELAWNDSANAVYRYISEDNRFQGP